MKLFDSTHNETSPSESSVSLENYDYSSEDYYKNLLALESIEEGLKQTSFIYALEDKLNKEKIGSESYKTTLEISSMYLKEITDNIGMPALETFDNYYTKDEGHRIAIESIGSVLKKIWQAIKNFFISLFKAIKRFFKGMVGTNEEIEKQSKQIEHKIDTILSNNPNVTVEDVIKSKLPSMFFDDVSKSKGDIEFYEVSKEKINNLITALDNNKLTNIKGLNGFIRDNANLLIEELKILYENNHYDFSISKANDKEREIYIPALETYIFTHSIDSSYMKNLFIEQNTKLDIKDTSNFTLISLFPEENNKFNTPNEVNLVLGYYSSKLMYSATEFDYTFKAMMLDINDKNNKSPVESELQIPSTVPNLKNVMDFYSSFKGKVDVKEFQKAIDDLSKFVMEVTSEIEKNIDNINTAEYGELRMGTVTVKAPYNIIQYFRELENNNIDEYSVLVKSLTDISASLKSKKNGYYVLTDKIKVHKNDMIFKDNGLVITIKNISSNDLTSSQEIQSLKQHISMFMKGYLTAITSTANIYSTKLLKTYTDINVAYMEYISESVKKYQKEILDQK